jgi:hypothetical protein
MVLETMGTKYKYSKLKSQDLRLLSKLFLTSRNIKFSNNYLEKKYNNFFSKKFKNFGFGCFNNGNLISHCGLVSLEMSFANKTYYLGQLCDSVTHPDYVNKGFYTQSLKHLEKYSKKKGFNGLVVFSNESSSRVMKRKQNWKYLNTFKYYEINVKTIPIFNLFYKIKLLKLYNLFVKIICIVSNSNKAQSNSNKINYIATKYTESFINYKKYNNNYRLKIFNNHVWFKLEDGIIIGDIENIDEKSAIKVIRAIKFFCVIMGLRKMKIITYPGSQIDKSVNKLITPKKERIDVYVNIFSGIDPSKLKFNFSDSNTF